MIPENLKQMVDQYLLERSERTVPVEQKQIPEFGDVINVNGNLLFVYNVHEERAFCNAFLTHTFYEFLTGDDTVIKNSETTLLFDIVVQTDCPTNIFFKDINRYVGKTLTSFEKEKLNEAWKYNGPSLNPLDARWNFKLQQGGITSKLSEAVVYHNLYCLEEGIDCECLK